MIKLLWNLYLELCTAIGMIVIIGCLTLYVFIKHDQYHANQLRESVTIIKEANTNAPVESLMGKSESSERKSDDISILH